jgi:predicted outer membrane protein
MRHAFLGSLLVALAVVQPAVAQTPAPVAAPQASISKEDFRRLALIGVSFDYASSQLALAASSRNRIKRYAGSLTGDFRFNYARLANGAGAFSGIPALPTDQNIQPPPFSDERRAARLKQLATVEGQDFDRLYVDMQVGTRQEILGLYEAYARAGSDPTLLAFARERLPLLQKQYEAARRLSAR